MNETCEGKQSEMTIFQERLSQAFQEAKDADRLARAIRVNLFGLEQPAEIGKEATPNEKHPKLPPFSPTSNETLLTIVRLLNSACSNLEVIVRELAFK